VKPRTCDWCDGPLPPGSRRLYCSVEHRRAQGRYLERLPGWQAELARLEADGATWPGGVPTYIVNEIAQLQARIRRYR
jgi:hypothetical protein